MSTITSPFAPAVHNDTTSNFAKQILDDRRYDLCPLLADAILDAGGDEWYAKVIRGAAERGIDGNGSEWIRALATLTAEQVAEQIAKNDELLARARFRDTCLSRSSGVVAATPTLTDLAKRITRRRPRGSGSKAELAKRLAERMGERAGRNWSLACKGQRGPSVRQAREMVEAIEAAVEQSQVRVRERIVDAIDVIRSARAADTSGGDFRNGGTVTAQSYKYQWSTTTIGSSRQSDGTVRVTINRTVRRELRYSARWWRDVTVAADVLRGGGEFAIRRAHGWDCYDAAGELVGVAVPMPADLKSRFGERDHGKTVAEANAEIERKRSILAVELEAKRIADAATAEAKRLEQRADRAARLLARLGVQTLVGYDDARAAGACDAGIRAFGAKLGVMDTAAKIPLAEIAKIEPGYAVRLARRVIQQRHAVAV